MQLLHASNGKYNSYVWKSLKITQSGKMAQSQKKARYDVHTEILSKENLLIKAKFYFCDSLFYINLLKSLIERRMCSLVGESDWLRLVAC